MTSNQEEKLYFDGGFWKAVAITSGSCYWKVKLGNSQYYMKTNL